MRSLWGVGGGALRDLLIKNTRKGREWSAGLGVSEITLVWKVVPHNLDESDATFPKFPTYCQLNCL